MAQVTTNSPPVSYLPVGQLMLGFYQHREPQLDQSGRFQSPVRSQRPDLDAMSIIADIIQLFDALYVYDVFGLMTLFLEQGHQALTSSQYVGFPLVLGKPGTGLFDIPGFQIIKTVAKLHLLIVHSRTQ